MIGEAGKLNTPLSVRRTEQPPKEHSYIRCNVPNVTLEAVKRSEVGKSLIVGVVERQNAHPHAKLTFDREYSSAHLCDLMENAEEEFIISGE